MQSLHIDGNVERSLRELVGTANPLCEWVDSVQRKLEVVLLVWLEGIVL